MDWMPDEGEDETDRNKDQYHYRLGLLVQAQNSLGLWQAPFQVALLFHNGRGQIF